MITLRQNTQEHREWLELVAIELSENPNPDLSEWPDEMQNALVEHFKGLLAFLREVQHSIRNGTDTNELRAKSLIAHLQLRKGPGKPSAQGLNTSLLLQETGPYRTLRVLMAVQKIPYTSKTIDTIAGIEVTVEDVLVAHRYKNTEIQYKNGEPFCGWTLGAGKLPKIEDKFFKLVADELELDDSAGTAAANLSKTVYKHRMTIHSLPQYQAFLRTSKG